MLYYDKQRRKREKLENGRKYNKQKLKQNSQSYHMSQFVVLSRFATSQDPKIQGETIDEVHCIQHLGWYGPAALSNGCGSKNWLLSAD